MTAIEERFFKIANKHFDGHYTILGFTGDVRVEFGTLVYPFSGEGVYREIINLMPNGKTVEEAMEKAIDSWEKEDHGGLYDKDKYEIPAKKNWDRFLKGE